MRNPGVVTQHVISTWKDKHCGKANTLSQVADMCQNHRQLSWLQVLFSKGFKPLCTTNSCRDGRCSLPSPQWAEERAWAHLPSSWIPINPEERWLVLSSVTLHLLLSSREPGPWSHCLNTGCWWHLCWFTVSRGSARAGGAWAPWLGAPQGRAQQAGPVPPPTRSRTTRGITEHFPGLWELKTSPAVALLGQRIMVPGGWHWDSGRWRSLEGLGLARPKLSSVPPRAMKTLPFWASSWVPEGWTKHFKKQRGASV